jgi:glyoxylase-like metal-dependent hydrolase (beta-lactamase superfamily II)
MELEPGIRQMTIGREPFKGFPPPNAFLVSGTDASLLIDAGYDSEEDHRERMAYIAEAGVPPIVELMITHRHSDHGGGAALYHQATGVPLTCHPLDREAIEEQRLDGRAPIAGELNDGDVRDLGGLTVEVVYAPGHTVGCLALYIRELSALITTDTVMQISTTVLRPGEGNLRDYVRTLQRFQEIAPKTMYAGHGRPSTDPAARLQQLIDHRAEREQQLFDALRISSKTVPEIRAILYVGLEQARVALAEDQVRTGIAKLIEDGAVRTEGDHYALA